MKQVVITGLGMITSIGFDVVTAAAAARAGLSRPAPIDSFEVLDPETGEAQPLMGHPIGAYTDGFRQFGRWLSLASGCWEDALAQCQLGEQPDEAFWRSTGLLLATPVADLDRFQLDEAWSARHWLERLGAPLLGAVPIGLQHVDVAPWGHAAAVFALERALQTIEQGRLERVFVLAVDSLVEPSTLEWLAASGRLAESEDEGRYPTGLSPGEASACFLLEAEPAARRRGAQSLARVSAVAVGREERDYFSTDINQGNGLAAVISQVLGDSNGFRGELLSDLNGEEWRARELAGARLRLGMRLSPAVTTLPAAVWGDTGAASGAAAVCLAVRAFVRGYDSGGDALITSSSEHGYVGAIRLCRG